MPNAMTLISTVTVGAGGASSILLDNIPQTFTDLVIKLSGRSVSTSNLIDVALRFNGSSSSYSHRYVYGTGSSTASTSNYTGTDKLYFGTVTKGLWTANTFGNTEIYIPNYAGSASKTVTVDSVSEQNSSEAYQFLTAGLWSNSAAITSISLFVIGDNLAQYSSASLYGITKGSGGATVS